MPLTGSRRPPAPTCEDCWDEDTQNSLTDPRAPANTAIKVKRSKSSDLDSKSNTDKKSHDGSDSGYSSKAGTSDSVPSPVMKKGGDLKINTNPIERERSPYVFAPTGPEETRPSPTKMKAVKTEKQPKQVPIFVHPHGTCWSCDSYGYHVDLDRDILKRPKSVAPVSTQKVEKSPAPKSRTREESDTRPSTTRRSSSSRREARPLSMWVSPSHYAYPTPPMDFAHPMPQVNGWGLPQQLSQQGHQYPHFQYPYAPPTPVSGGYHQPPGFFDMSPMPYTHPTEPFYGDPAFHGHNGNAGHFNYPKQENESKRNSSRPRAATQKSKQVIEADRVSMPPPPRPEPVRPIIRKRSTDTGAMSYRRRSVFEDDDDEDEQPEVQAIVARPRNPSHSRPPSAYKPTHGAEIQNRPRARKSSSYSTPSGTVHVASSSRADISRRRTDPQEQKLANAQEYISKTSKPQEKEVQPETLITKYRPRAETDLEELYSSKTFRALSSNPSLTADSLKRLEQKTSSAVSDAGSVRSKHSSRDSVTGRTRAGTAMTSMPRMHNIVMENGVSVSIPADVADLDIILGNVRLSMNPTMALNASLAREDESPRELKRIERAPSEISHSSHRSLTSGSAVSAPKGREEYQVSRQKQISSKKSSRAPSSSRPRGETPSIDYSLLDESYYLEYGA